MTPEALKAAVEVKLTDPEERRSTTDASAAGSSRQQQVCVCGGGGGERWAAHPVRMAQLNRRTLAVLLECSNSTTSGPLAPPLQKKLRVKQLKSDDVVAKMDKDRSGPLLE